MSTLTCTLNRTLMRIRTRRFGPARSRAFFTALAAIFAPVDGALAQPTGGDGYDAHSAVAAVVKVRTPWYAPKAAVWSKMRDTIATYDNIPGLAFKAYSIAQVDGRYGGLYLWKDMASARAWFNAAWFERVEKERGAKGEVQFYEVPVAIDNTPGGTPYQLEGQNVSTVVSIAMPPGISKSRLAQEFEAAIPTYRAVPGLLRKHFTLTDDGRFGGIYLWKDRASADQWFNAAWKERVRKTYGADATFEWFDTAILLPSKMAANQPAIPGL